MIRAAHALDVPELLALEEKLFPNAMSEKMLQHELARGWGWVMLSEGGVVIGYILVRRDEDLLDITRLGVAPGFRRQGTGQQLLRKVLAEGQDIVLTVQKSNTPAIHLYRSNGFAVVGHLIAAGAWVMRVKASAPSG